AGQPGALRQGNHRDQPGPRHEIRVVKRCVRPGQVMQQSHLQGVLSSRVLEALDTPIVPVQRAPFTLPHPQTPIIDRWIEAKPDWGSRPRCGCAPYLLGDPGVLVMAAAGLANCWSRGTHRRDDLADELQRVAADGYSADQR